MSRFYRLLMKVIMLRCVVLTISQPFNDGNEQAADCPSKIHTTGGNAKGGCCVFPFRYKNKFYTSCTFDDHHEPWCATSDNFNRDKKWGVCSGDCPSKIHTTGGNAKGECCVFPFRYKNKLYTSCTFDDHHEPWCATSDNFNRDKKWGACFNEERTGCKPQKEECQISISSTKESKQCTGKRQHDVLTKRPYYTLTVDGKPRSTEFPLSEIPWLNHTMNTIRYRTTLDPFDSRWLTLANTFRKLLNGSFEKNKENFPSFENISDYENVRKIIQQEIKHLRAPEYFSNPTMESTFTNMMNRWQTDEMFVQQRLAGPCPFLLKKVTMDGTIGMKWSELKVLLNPSFDFGSATGRVLESNEVHLDMGELVMEGRLYVLYHEPINNIKSSNDFYGYYDNNTKLYNMTSPITLFVRTPSGDLKVVAIQGDYKQDSEVLTPNSDSMQWSIAKAMVNQADSAYCQATWHLSHIHFSSQIYCAIFRSHFSELHPIHQILRYHCEGTTPHIALAWMTLASNGDVATKLSTIGHLGFVKLAMNGYKKYHYGILAYDNLLKAHGLDSKDIKYHPFRDDGKLLWNTFKDFSRMFVNMFYTTNKRVFHDKELQSFANEVSIDGKVPPFGGRGKVKDFPSSFRTKKELQLFLTRFLWHIAMHASVNYPVEPWATFTPTMPFKLHNDSRTYKEQNIAYIFPNPPNAVGMMQFATLLGNLRVNRIMDHHDKMQDDRLKKLIKFFHHRFHSCIQKTLEDRNARRKSRGQMGFQYFEPKWLTNSNHI